MQIDSVSVEYLNVTFWNESTFTLASSVQDVFNEMTCRWPAESRQNLGWFIEAWVLYQILLSKLAKMLGDQLEILLCVYEE